MDQHKEEGVWVEVVYTDDLRRGSQHSKLISIVMWCIAWPLIFTAIALRIIDALDWAAVYGEACLCAWSAVIPYGWGAHCLKSSEFQLSMAESYEKSNARKISEAHEQHRQRKAQMLREQEEAEAQRLRKQAEAKAKAKAQRLREQAEAEERERLRKEIEAKIESGELVWYPPP